MKYALIGCGRISPNHIQAAVNNGLEIVALCDTSESSLCQKLDLAEEALNQAISSGNYANTSAHPVRFQNYKEMLNAVRPELVAIATPSGMHAKMAIDSLEAGANVIIEKPMALSLNDCDRIIETSLRTGKKVALCHQNRFNKSIAGIRKALDSDRFGRLFYLTAHVRWNRGPQYYAQAKWRGTWAQDGGVLMNQCIHAIDLMRWMLGDEISEVMAFTDNLNHPYIEAEDLGLAMLRAKNGSYGLLDGTSLVFPQNLEETMYFFGEKGTVKAGGKSLNAIDLWHFADASLNEEAKIIECFAEAPPNIYGFGHTPLYADMLEVLEGKKGLPLVDMYAGRRAVEAVLAIYLSSKERRPVKLPLEGELKCTDFEGLF